MILLSIRDEKPVGKEAYLVHRWKENIGNEETSTVRGAIAWTFGMKESEYFPGIET